MVDSEHQWTLSTMVTLAKGWQRKIVTFIFYFFDEHLLHDHSNYFYRYF